MTPILHGKALAAAAALASALTLASGAAATPVEIVSGSKAVEIGCTGVCQFWFLGSDPAGFSATDGSWLNIGTSNSNANRLAFVNATTGSSFDFQSESSDTGVQIGGAPIGIPEFTGGESGSWTGSAIYYLAWGGGGDRHILIRNFTANNTFTWTQTGQGAGLSGVDGVGVIPLPAPILMLLAALGGLGLVARKRGTASA
ncbi:MAG: VPLPA-CTERM sorting domain-containing protein [Alkalilacustris sp.]